jgi:diguanylate cyclase (GGDEF)-like protein
VPIGTAMTVKPHGARLRAVFASVPSWLPRGRTLPEASWRIRHRAVVVLLLAHAVIIGLYMALRGEPMADALIDTAIPALGAFAASRASLPRPMRSGIAAVSCMLTSAVVVHLMNGSIEGHFHFFAMIPVVALYEDWVPFGLAVGVVLVHHGVMGTIDPQSVYDHSSAWQHPWKWAFVHAGFFSAACIGAIINWRLHEKARDHEQSLAAQMRHQAHHDALTGLPNRVQLLEHARTLLAGAHRRDDSVAVLLIDLDRFKEINDVLGHASGDVLLSRLGPLMQTAVRDGDILARLGGDEFAAVLARADEKAATLVAKRLISLLTETVDIDGVALQVDGSIGIAVSTPGAGEDIDTLLRQADIAMYTAKRARCGYTLYQSDQDTSTRERLSLLGELRNAINHGGIVLHYQPKLALPSVELIGVEALARWQHPTRGLLGPAEFIPAAESTGLIVPLTLTVLELAITQLATWRSGGRDFTVAVNLSPRCLAEPDLTRQVTDLLTKHGVPARSLELEITENTLAHDPERALATLTALHAAGIQISIDDFGTGYSSMSYLKRLPVSELKVDRSFVSGMLGDAEDAVLVRSLVDLGHNLGLTVVAEGVEDQATLDALADLGCDIAQGFHLGRPMTAGALETWLGDPVTRDDDLPLQRRGAVMPVTTR